MKLKIQSIIITLGIISLGIGIWQILQTKTLILPPWILLPSFLLGTLGISFILAVLARKILNLKWHILTLSSLFVIICCSLFYISQYKPLYRIIIPKNYEGEIRLFVSNEKENDFLINQYGIGYINKKTFDNGFYPKIVRGGIDITKKIKEYSKGGIATMPEDIYSYEYLSFSIPITGREIEDKDIEALIKIKAIDTSRLYRK